MSLARSSRLTDAIGVLQHVLALWPQAGVALKLLGLLLHYVGRDAESIQVLDRAIALRSDPASADAAAYKCAIASISASDETMGNCYAAAQVYPTADLQLVLAAALHSRGNYPAAHESILRSVAQRQTELGFAMKGAIEARLGNTSEAAASYQRAVGLAIGSGRQ
jgi:tetratricopeptide (TPR) repeat protein